jgi:rifampicin phosphotransferase
VHRRLVAYGPERAFIFRSSTNAEDLPGFNGAGLYESIRVPAGSSIDQIADQLRAVWSSVWLQRAFEEREWFRIEHVAVNMAILVQPFIEDAVATGVAITGNPFKPDLKAVYINSQIRGSTVTGATGNELPEQYLVQVWAGDYDPELLCRSSLAAGALILDELRVVELTKILMRIDAGMLPNYGRGSNAMDVEFALRGDGSFVVLQARPYTVVYNLDRAPKVRRTDTLLQRIGRRLRVANYRLKIAFGSLLRRPSRRLR